MYKTIFFLLFTVLVSFSCKNDEKTALLIGSWKGATWIAGDKDAAGNASDVRFEFREDGTYSAQYGDQMENGEFHLRGEKLYTTASGSSKVEKMVQLSTITPDTLVMEMSRVGNAEQLTLVRIKQ